jgi:hypothetical protein
MQRMVESTVIVNILKKYEQRYEECSKQWDNDMTKLKGLTEQEESDNDRKNFLFNDILALNAQLSAYECIIKDLKGLVK